MKKTQNVKAKHLLPTASLALALLATLNPRPSTVFAQGSLTPPGAPAPTMKTLAQIEPRTPISTAPFTISLPGSYYLTTNLSVASSTAIIIATNGVTLDLAGFTISSTDPSPTAYGILIRSGLGNLTILNGFIQGGVTNNAGTYDGPGFKYGLYYAYSGTASWNTRVAGVSVCGCQLYGIYLGRGESTVVESCTVRTVGGIGIAGSTIKSSVAVDCGGTAISGDQVSDSRGECTGTGIGLYALAAQNCCGTSAGGYGLYAYMALSCYGSSLDNQGLYAVHTAQNCYGHSDSSTGLYAYGTALNCYGSSSSGDGLYATSAQGSYGHSSGSGAGLSTTAALNCYGSSESGNGLYTYTAQNCRGESSGAGHGILASETAQNCYGLSASGTGLSAEVAQNCVGWGNGTGLYAEQIAIGCFGHSSTSGKALRARIANSCHGYDTSAATSEDITYKYNMP